MENAAINLHTIEHLPVPIILFDSKKIYFLNKRARNLFKISKEKSKNTKAKSIFDLLKPVHHKSFRKSLKLLFNETIFPTAEFEFKDLKDNDLLLEINSNLAILNGKTVVQASLNEITLIKRTQDLLEETKEKFELITNNSHDIICFFSYFPRQKYLYVSPNIKSIIGNDPEELMKEENFFRNRAVGDISELMKIDKLLKQAQNKNIYKNYDCFFKIEKKDREQVWLQKNVMPVKDERGKIRFFMSLIRDVTDQKEKEIELQVQYSNYQNLLDNSQVAYVINNHGTIVYCNKEALKLLRLKDKKQILGKFAADFFPKDERKKAIARIREVYRTQDKNERTEYKLLDSKGNKIEVEIRSNLIKFNNEDCVLSSIINISQQRQLEREKLRSEITEQNFKLLQKEIEEKHETERKLIEKTGRLSSILENTNHLIWSVDKEKRILSFNRNFYNAIWSKYKVKIKEGDKVHELLGKDQKENVDFWYTKYERVFNGEKLEFESEDKIKNGDKIYRKIFINPILDEKGKVIEVSCIAHDISEAKIYEQKLKAQSAKLNAIFESGLHLCWTINKKREITSCNKNYEDTVSKIQRIPEAKDNPLYSKKAKKMHLLDVGIWDKQYKIAFSGKSTEFITEQNAGKTKVIRQIYLQPIFNQEGKVEEVSGIAHDITDKKTSEQKLYNQAAKLNSIFDSSHHYIWTIDNEQKLTSFNKNYFSLIANLYNTQPYIGLVLNRGILSNNVEYNELLQRNYEKAFKGEPANFELEVLDKSYNKIYLDIFLNPIFEGNNVIEVSGIAHNVTEKKIAQQRIELSLKEKDVLLKEVHHRVKNNMQVISSILNLQSSYVSDEYTLSLLKESQNRIKTMAYIHESLYQNKSFTSVNFSDYITTLSGNVIQSYAVSEAKIQLILNLEKINLNLDNSIPTGLILNELLTNAIKHAFRDTKKGQITINLKSENNTVYLEVKDNGAGFDPSINFRNTNSLGLQLVNTLADQIGAELTFKSELTIGTQILIVFKM